MLKNYSTFKDKMILRDFLALDRTVLANERTLLSYIRSFIGSFSAGIAMIKLFDSLLTNVLGYIFVIVSPFFVIIGVIRYIQISKRIKIINEAEIDENAGEGQD